MGRATALRALYVLAASCVLAVSAGVVVPPHQEEPGTPAQHDHVLAAYRFSFLVPAVELGPDISPAMAKLHATLLKAGVPPEVIWQMPGMDPRLKPSALPTIKSAATSPVQDLAIVLALLVALIPRLPRPDLRAVAEIALPHASASLWRLAPVLPPPRAVVLP